jgi:hypothetical protein
MKNPSLSVMLLFLFICAVNNAQVTTAGEVSTETLVEKESLPIEKSSTTLDEAIYWDIIESSLKATTNQEDQELYLINELEKLSPAEIIGFRLQTDKLLYDSYNQKLWCAAYIMNNGCTDGGFEYFRCWLISRGKEAFYKTKEDPDYLVNLLIKDQDVYEFEGFWYVAMNAFKNKTENDLYSYIDYDNFTTNDENYPILTFIWNVDDPQTMIKICPELYQKSWNK